MSLFIGLVFVNCSIILLAVLIYRAKELVRALEGWVWHRAVADSALVRSKEWLRLCLAVLGLLMLLDVLLLLNYFEALSQGNEAFSTEVR